jgi:hypothetical protein
MPSGLLEEGGQQQQQQQQQHVEPQVSALADDIRLSDMPQRTRKQACMAALQVAT